MQDNGRQIMRDQQSDCMDQLYVLNCEKLTHTLIHFGLTVAIFHSSVVNLSNNLLTIKDRLQPLLEVCLLTAPAGVVIVIIYQYRTISICS